MIEIIAHRGASRDCLENTLAAFERALEERADGIELDVHATRDGQVVVHHDPTVRRSSLVEPVPIAGLLASELADVRLSDGSRVPRLDEVFDLVGGRAVVYVEVKAAGMELPLLECLAGVEARHGDARFAVHSFDHRIPSAVRAARPTTPIGFLSASYPMDVGQMLGAQPPAALWQAGDLIDGPLVRAAHDKGARVIAWTVNRPTQARALIELGVDAVCTDSPGLLRAGLAG